ncbi:terminase small subunit [Pseudoalteromonas sp.]|uniref:terminase small subunit n=1 Tax=Pseudoalteromonas sp. TaxID=53249 RepID=UPI0035644ED8
MAAGRPTDYKDELLTTAKEYIDSCPDIVPSVVGLCLHIGIAKSTAYRWADEGKEEFKDILELVNNQQERRLLSGGLTNDFNSAITKMMLTKHGYTDKTETDITTKGKTINTWTITPVTTNKE